MPYKKYDPKVDVLKTGTKICLAGREGKITGYCSQPDLSPVDWEDSNSDSNMMDLREFPDLEILVQPLTIPREVRDKLREIASSFYHAGDSLELNNFINSLEVTND